MSRFNPIEFLNLAESLYKDAKYAQLGEARDRTSISRAYYATFLHLREAIKININSTFPPEYTSKFETISQKGVIHRCVLDIVRQLDLTSGMQFGKLMQLRRVADYELDKKIRLPQVKEAIGLAKELTRRSRVLMQGFSTKSLSIKQVILRIYEKIITRGK